jgi:dihydrofolate reductase
MGRKTFKVDRPRNDVTMFVLSKSMKPQDGITVLRDVREITEPPDGKVLWVCGGAAVYSQLLEHCSELYVSYIHGNYKGDTFFPAFEHLFHVKTVVTDRPEWTTKIMERNGFDS